VTHLYVSWAEIWRLARTYGFPASLSAELFVRQQHGTRPDLGVLDGLVKLGVRRQDLKQQFAARLHWRREAERVVWPAATLYTMPWVPTPATAPAPTSQPTTPPAMGK